MQTCYEDFYGAYGENMEINVWEDVCLDAAFDVGWYNPVKMVSKV